MESQILKEDTKDLLGSQFLTDHQNASQICYGHIWYYATEKLYMSFPRPPPSTTPEIHCIMVCLLDTSFLSTMPNSRKLRPQLELSAHQVFCDPDAFQQLHVFYCKFPSIYYLMQMKTVQSECRYHNNLRLRKRDNVYSLLVSDQSKMGSYVGPAL